MKRFLLLWISFIVVLETPLLHAAEAAEPSDHGTTMQEILILNSYHPGYGWSDDEQGGVIEVLREKDKHWVPVIEYLDLKRLPDGRHLAELKNLFRLKYQDKKFSVVIAMDNPALEFAIDNQAELFRNAPIVFCGINNYTPSMLKGHADVTGIVEAIDIAGTIEAMLRLHPVAREIFSPHDYTATGLAVRKELEALVPRFGAKVRFRFTDPLTMEELSKELERLPKDSLVLEIGFITDKSGRTFGISETTKLFSEHSPVPIYSAYEQRLGFGIVGGKLLSARIHGANAARIALRVLAGEKASAIPVVSESDSQFRFDYKVMSRFGIPLSALPEGSTVINKPVSFYAAHRVVIQVALGVTVFMAVVISLLTVIIIQRRRTLEVIRRSEELFKVITSSTPDHLTVQDKGLRYSFVMNPQLGLTEQDMIGKTDHDFLSKEDADKLTQIKRQVLNTGRPVHAEVPLISLNGEQQFFDGSYVPKFDARGQVDGLIGYFRNVTERTRAELVLQGSEERHRTILQTAMDGFWLVDMQGRLLDVNAAYCRMSGYSAQELLALRISDLEAAEATDDTAAHIQKVLMQGEDRFESRHRRKDGSIMDVEISVQHRPIDGGQFVAFLQDLTARKRAEEEQATLEGQLRQAQKMESVGRLAGGVAHDFNNMLSVILGHVELALAQVDPTQPLHADLEEIRTAAERSAALTRQLLAFARQQIIAPTVLDLNATVEGMLTMLRRLIGENIQLTWQPAATLWPVKVDPSQIDQILANLCVNARDAIADVGTITLETGNTVFDDAYCAAHAGGVPGEYVRLTVRDTGCGMDPDTLAHLFEPFFTTKGVGEGTGLGLATVYGIVKQNHGFINVYSEPGQGTTFTLALPRHVAEPAPRQPAGPADPALRGHETILLVEDEPAILALTTRMLALQGYTVLAARTPGDALRLAREHPGELHLLMTDVVMPEMNGRALAQTLLAIYPTLKRLFMSGYPANVIAHHGVLEAGVAFLQKPFSLTDLAAKVREALEREEGVA